MTTEPEQTQEPVEEEIPQIDFIDIDAEDIEPMKDLHKYDVDEAQEMHKLTISQECNLFMMRAKIREAKVKEAKTKESYSTAKKYREAMEEDLGAFLDSIEVGPGPLFQPEEPKVQSQDGDLEEWERDIELEIIKNPSISHSTLKSLRDHNPSIMTVGTLVAWQREKLDWWAKDIDGIGPSASEEIENAMTGVWRRRAERAERIESEKVEETKEEEPSQEVAE